MTPQAAAEALVRWSRRLVPDGLAVLTSGNLSLRLPSGDLVITPTGVGYDSMTATEVSRVAQDGTLLGGLKPSSELPMHLQIYRARPDVGAVVHTHSLYATMLAATGRSLPPVHYMVGLLGPAVPLVPYHPYGSDALAQAAAEALAGGVEAAILANHGAIAVGETLETAYERARLLEWLSELYVGTLGLGGPTLLSPEEVSEVRLRLRHYGQGRET